MKYSIIMTIIAIAEFAIIYFFLIRKGKDKSKEMLTERDKGIEKINANIKKINKSEKARAELREKIINVNTSRDADKLMQSMGVKPD